MSANKIPLAALAAAALFSQSVLEVSAQMPPTPREIAMTCHQDLLDCYQQLGKNAETGVEYKWLLQQKPGDATMHYNYACFLQRAGNTAGAAAEYKSAANLAPSNVEFVGAYGQMAFFQKKYTEAYQFLGRAQQMPGGDKYKASFESCKVYLQNAAQQQAINQMNKQKSGGGAAGATKKPRDDDDD